MDTPQQSSSARLAAILALIAAFLIILVVVVASLAGGNGSEGPGSRGDGQQRAAKESKQSERKIYVVKPGDCCLSQIAQKTGIDVDVLVQLNPNLDPQAIHSGDRVKLR